jgi:uncharacterized membrane protein YecN with MAPEG domain
MSALDVVSTGALVLMSATLLMLLMQALRLREIWQVMLDCQKNARWASIWEMENKELCSALRAERAHVEQLRRKVAILQALVPVASGE